MPKLWRHLFKVSPAILGASLIVGHSAMAAPTIEIGSQPTKGATTNELNRNSTESEEAPSLHGGVSLTDNKIAQAVPTSGAQASQSELTELLQRRHQLKRFNDTSQSEPMSQVTSVSELRDVSPTEWAYEALRSLVERYGCIVGYPDRTYRGTRALTRWEFAAGLNACMNTIERLIQENVGVLKEDVEALKRLAEEFQTELAALGARVDNLEARTTFLEDHQFSTTTKLRGEVVVSIADSFGDRAGGDEDESQTVLQDRVRLNFETSFTGKDLLRTRLQAGNFSGNTFNQSGVTGTNMTRLAYDDGTDNDVTIDDLWYRFPIGNFTGWVGTSGLNLDDVFYTVNPFLSDSGTGSLSRFLRYNNFINRGPDGTGAALRYKFGDTLNFTAAYLSDRNEATDDSEGNGIFNGSFSTGAQLGFVPSDGLEFAVGYVHTYRTPNDGETNAAGLFGNVSSDDAEFPFGNDVATTAERFSLQASVNLGDSINLAAWGGYGFADAQVDDEDLDQVDLWTWAATVSFIDLGKEGAVLTLGGGMPPKGDSEDSSYLVQAQYKFPISDNILITPGAYVVFNPNHDDDNETIYIGVLRTTFKF